MPERPHAEGSDFPASAARVPDRPLGVVRQPGRLLTPAGGGAGRQGRGEEDWRGPRARRVGRPPPSQLCL